MKLFIFISIFTVSLFSQEIFGTVSKIKGEAYETTKEKKTILLKFGDKVSINSTLFTKEKSRLIIKFGNDIIALNQNCELFLDQKSVVTQENGSIFYNIDPVKSFTKAIKKLSEDRFKIKTKTTIIGIRGTDFIVDTDNIQKVFLRNGRLNISSIEKEFKIYKKKQLDEFSTYKQNLNKEFNRFVKTQEYEFNQYKKEFTLEENRYVYIKDGKVYQGEFSKETNLMFDELDMFISE